MSEPMRVAFVVEGPTDYYVVREVVRRMTGKEDIVATRLQPPDDLVSNDQGELGGGWKGVLRWCDVATRDWPGLVGSAVLANNDLLVVHVDADIAGESDLAAFDLQRPCPPASDTCDSVHAFIWAELRACGPVPSVVLCVPTQSTETWVVAAFHPGDAAKFDPIECRPSPEALLVGKSHGMVVKKDKGYRKVTARYRANAPQISGAWNQITGSCSQATRFQQDLEEALTS